MGLFTALAPHYWTWNNPGKFATAGHPIYSLPNGIMNASVMYRMWLSPVLRYSTARPDELPIIMGGADTVSALAFPQLGEVLDFLKSNSAL